MIGVVGLSVVPDVVEMTLADHRKFEELMRGFCDVTVDLR